VQEPLKGAKTKLLKKLSLKEKGVNILVSPHSPSAASESGSVSNQEAGAPGSSLAVPSASPVGSEFGGPKDGSEIAPVFHLPLLSSLLHKRLR